MEIQNPASHLHSRARDGESYSFLSLSMGHGPALKSSNSGPLPQGGEGWGCSTEGAQPRRSSTPRGRGMEIQNPASHLHGWARAGDSMSCLASSQTQEGRARPAPGWLQVSTAAVLYRRQNPAPVERRSSKRASWSVNEAARGNAPCERRGSWQTAPTPSCVRTLPPPPRRNVETPAQSLRSSVN